MGKVIFFVCCNLFKLSVIFNALKYSFTLFEIFLCIFHLTFFELNLSPLSEHSRFLKQVIVSQKGQSAIDVLVSGQIVFFFKINFSVFRVNSEDFEASLSVTEVNLITEKLKGSININFCFINLATFFLDIGEFIIIVSEVGSLFYFFIVVLFGLDQLIGEEEYISLIFHFS
jgi:hypothetical protein